MKPDAIDALLEEIDQIAREYDGYECGLPIRSYMPSHAASIQAMREAVSRFVEEVKKEMTNGSGTVQGRSDRISVGGGDHPAVRPRGDGDKVADAPQSTCAHVENGKRCGLKEPNLFHHKDSARFLGFDAEEFPDREFHPFVAPTPIDSVIPVADAALPSAQREAEGAPKTSTHRWSEIMAEVHPCGHTEAQHAYYIQGELRLEPCSVVASECSAAPPTNRTVKLGVIEFHSPSFNPGLIERFFAVTKDLRDSASIVDLWLMDIATVLREFGYEMTITTDRRRPVLAGADRSPETDAEKEK